MRRKPGWLLRSSLGPALIVLGSWDRPAEASGIASSWSGASASTTYDSQSYSQQGATATASSGSQSNLTIQAGYYPNQTTMSLATSGVLMASATDDPAHLLQVAATSNAPNPGSSYILQSANDSGTASASWSNDAVMVKAPVGSNLPDMIRLNFTLTFTTPGTLPYASLTATFNGQQDSVNSTYGITFAHADASGDTTNAKPASVDTTNANGGTNSSSEYPVGGLKDTFHVDLPLDKTGLSAPFNLGLTLNPPMGINRDMPTFFDGLGGTLALTSVTLPDGTSLSSLGDSVSFESGLASPNPVPEPASLLAWALGIAAVGSAAARFRR